jgi:hypothetical protein
MKAKDTIRELRGSLDSLIIIHYSCEGLDDTNQGLSPRITTIATLHVGSMTMHSLSIHLIAEIEKISKDEIDGRYDRLEERMLDDFFAFASWRSDCSWLHWKMSNINFGFETLEHRFRVHQPDKQPYKINDSKKCDLSSLILAIYGEKCVDHPHMPNLMELNGGKNRDVLSGKEEVEAFKAKEYVKVHKSTMSKVYWFKKVFFLLAKRKVVTSHSNLPARINDFSESWIFKLASIVAMLFVCFQIGETSLKYFDHREPSNNPLQPSGPKK